ncbi:unnamed protein product [Psylliodes chrysocephalus]|uniref:Flagellar radial spoke protein n=1 Tax=Psylliodes chrysocephalus TaxID=3402493 RepID=A0A9P0G9P9_9CUCU|nr:unnamed protein product [Psylliodes chrysocephala]
MTLEDKPATRKNIQPKSASKDNIALEVHKNQSYSATKLFKNEYTFSSSPRALYNNRKMAKGGDAPYSNVMFERRIYRGTNFGAMRGHEGDGESAAAKAAEAQRRAKVRAKAAKNIARLRLGSPPAVSGRKHERIQTEDYLEEIFVNPPVNDICTQTDLFLDRPVSPFYVTAKTGIDTGTQIYPGDLFDFDMEVQPILEVLVGKTIEQSLLEVLEEEELAALREQQRKFLERRSVETAEAIRLEEREKRLVVEKERRIGELEEGLKCQKEMEEKIAAAVLMQGYMADLLPSVLEGLESDGFLMDSIKQDLEDSFMPWLVKEVTTELQEMVSSRDILCDIVREILEQRNDIYENYNKDIEEVISLSIGGDENDYDDILQDHIRLQEEIRKDMSSPKPDADL